MLYIHIKEPENGILLVDRWFNRNKKKDWFNQDFVREVILGIDQTAAVKDEYLESPVFGGMSPDRLSSGCKAVIALYVQDKRPVLVSCCGDNCIPYILKVSDMRDAHIYLRHCMKFPMKFEAVFADSGVAVSTRREYVEEYYRIKKKVDNNEWG